MIKKYGQNGVAGTVELGKGGVKIKNNAGVFEARNNADSALAVARAADPVSDTDLVTLGYLKRRANVTVVEQIDGNTPPVGNFNGEIRIVTAAGGTFALKELYYWNSGTAAWVQMQVFTNMVIAIAIALTGGTDTYLADHLYTWDADTSAWVDVGPAGASGKTEINRRGNLTIADHNVAKNIDTTVDANTIMTKVLINVTQAFAADATLAIGDAGQQDRLADNSLIDLNTVGTYIVDLYHTYGAVTQITALLDKGSAVAGNVNVLVIGSKA